METTHLRPQTNKTLKILLIVLAVLFVICSLCSVVGLLLFRATSSVIRTEVEKYETQIQDEIQKDNETVQPSSTPTVTATSIEDKDPEQIMGTDLPANFPKDFPVYSGATVGYATANAAKGELAVSFDVPATNAKVIEFYKKELPATGWTILQEITVFGHSFVSSKGNQNAGIIIIGNGESTTLVVTIESLK